MFDEKSQYLRFFFLMPFCYTQTKPLAVPVYSFGFCLSVLKHFFLSPIELPFYRLPPGGAQFAGGKRFALPEARAETGGFCVAKLG